MHPHGWDAIRVNGAAPGASAMVTLTKAGPTALVNVQSVAPGGFWLRIEAPGAQTASVIGVAH